MSKVYCASIDCEYNYNNVCEAKVIDLSDGHIHTVHQGFKHIHECRTYKKSQYYEELEQFLQDFNNSLKGGGK